MPPVDPILLAARPDDIDPDTWATALVLGKLLRDADVDISDLAPYEPDPPTTSHPRPQPAPKRPKRPKRTPPKPKPKRPKRTPPPPKPPKQKRPSRDERYAALIAGPDGPHPPRDT